MNRLRLLAMRLRAMFAKPEMDRALDEELQSHFDMLVEQNIGRGMAPAEARRAARLELGGADQIKESVRDQRGLPLLESLWQDVRYGARMLRKSPGFTAVAVLTLALGIGANTAIFSVVDSVLLRPLPYSDPSRLVWADEYLPRFNDAAVPDAEFISWNAGNHTFEAMAAYDGGDQANLTGVGEPERIETVTVTSDLFKVLGIRPAYGRGFLPGEAAPGGPLSVILTYGLWQRKFGSDPAIIGKSIALEGRSYGVIGIMPRDFRFPDKSEEPECLLSFQFPPKPDWSPTRAWMITRVIGRLNRGVSYDQARADLSIIASQSTTAMPVGFSQMRQGLQVHVISLHDKLVGDVRLLLLVLLAAVGFVLLIACANIANLQLVRTMGRQREFAVRAAIGGSRARLLQQMLTEGALLAVLGGSAGILIAGIGVRLLRIWAPSAIRQVGPIALDRWVFVFALGITGLTAALFAVAPAFGASRLDLNSSLKDGGMQNARGFGHRRLRSALVIVEFTLAFVLLVGSGLLIRSFFRLSSVNPGFEPSGVLTVSTLVPETKYASPAQRLAFFSQLVDRVSALPAVRSVGLATSMPLTRYWSSAVFFIEGKPAPPNGMGPMVPCDEVSPEYFRAIGIPLIGGRFFKVADLGPDAHVAIVSSDFGERFLSGDALGKRLRFGPPDSPWFSIVGVVGDARHLGLDHEIDPQVYFPYAGASTSATFLVLRTDSDPRSLASAVRAQVTAIDPAQPIFNVATMAQRLSDSLDAPRFNMTLLGIFAALALLLATIGIYGVVSFFVSQRTHEIGIRVALGATPPNILRLVVGQGIALIFTGVMLGAAAALAVSRYLSSLLYGVRPWDPVTLVAVAALLVLVALAACYIPARRAMRVDPMVALRYE